MNLNDIEFENGSMDELLGTPSTSEVVEPTQTQEEEVMVPDFTDDSTSEEEPSSNGGSGDTDVITQFLSNYGIIDGKITFENDNDEIEERNFNELSPEEQLNILKEITAPDLSETEIQTLNFLRYNNVTLQDVIEYYSQQAVNNYIASNSNKSYSIDEYTDDELYIADLKMRMPDITEDEIAQDLESAKDNTELFAKKVSKIRDAYKARENQEALAAKEQRDREYNTFVSNINESIKTLAGIPLDYKDSESVMLTLNDSERDAMYRYLINKDENGRSSFSKDLEDPKMLASWAWFRLYGMDAISDITNYWKNELKNTRREAQKPAKQAQTTVKPVDNKTQKITNYHQGFDFVGGENLL